MLFVALCSCNVPPSRFLSQNMAEHVPQGVVPHAPTLFSKLHSRSRGRRWAVRFRMEKTRRRTCSGSNPVGESGSKCSHCRKCTPKFVLVIRSTARKTNSRSFTHPLQRQCRGSCQRQETEKFLALAVRVCIDKKGMTR